MIIKAFDVFGNSNILKICKRTVYHTKSGEGYLETKASEVFSQREKMLQLKEELLVVEEERFAGKNGYSLTELEVYLESAISLHQNSTKAKNE